MCYRSRERRNWSKATGIVGLGFLWLTLGSPGVACGQQLTQSEPARSVPPTAVFPAETSPSSLPSEPSNQAAPLAQASRSHAASSPLNPAPALPNAAPPYAASLPPSQVAPYATNAPLTQAEPSSTTATPTQHFDEPSTESSNEGGLLGPIRLGPMLGAGLPNLLNFGLLLKITKYFGAGVNIGLIPTVRVSYYGEATLRYNEFDAFARIHPFAGGFFMGSGLGYATISGTFTDTFDTTAYASQIPAGLGIPNQVTYSSEGSVRTLVITPQIGYFYTTKVGFSIGLDFGAQVPIAPSRVEFESQLPLAQNAPPQLVQAVQTELLNPSDSEVRNTLETIGRTPIPTVNVRIGWLL